MSAVRILTADTPALIREVRQLLEDYMAENTHAQCFISFSGELAELPGKYAPPQGALLLAEYDGQFAGCVALRPLESGICEMKRLYVRPAFRQHKVGWQLTSAIIAEGRKIGYRAMRLDTLKTMHAALALYGKLGFQPIPPYGQNLAPEIAYLELAL